MKCFTPACPSSKKDTFATTWQKKYRADVPDNAFAKRMRTDYKADILYVDNKQDSGSIFFSNS